MFRSGPAVHYKCTCLLQLENRCSDSLLCAADYIVMLSFVCSGSFFSETEGYLIGCKSKPLK